MRNNSGWGRAFAAMFVTLLVFVAVIAAAWIAFPPSPATITIDGDTVSMAGMDGWTATLAIAAVVVAVLLALMLAALAVVFALVCAALGISVGLLAVVAALALVASPFLLVGWLVWRLLRPAPAATAAAA